MEPVLFPVSSRGRGLAAAQLFVFGGIFAARAAAPALENGSFEQGLQGWTVTATADAAAVARVLPEAASFGRQGLRVRNTPACPQFNLVSAAVPVTVGRTYTVSYWCGGGEPGVGGMTVEMVFVDGKGARLNPAQASIRKWPRGAAAAARCFENPVIAAAAPEGAVSFSVHIHPANAKPAGPVDLDDFIVTELPETAPAAVEVKPGQAHPVPPFDPVRLQACLDDLQADPHRGQPPPKIVLKLDDFRPVRGKPHPQWLKVADFAKSKNLKVNFGIVAQGLAEECPDFVAWTKERNASGMIEFWNHGWDHGERAGENGKRIQEFCGESYEYQKKHLTDSNRLAREKLGFPFVTFGAPFNSTDASTLKVLSEDPDIKVWLYGDVKNSAGKTVLDRTFPVSLESPTFIPNYAAFVEGYAHNRAAAYFVLQGHPANWNDERWEQFVKIVEFLTAQNAEFVLARDVAAALPAK